MPQDSKDSMPLPPESRTSSRPTATSSSNTALRLTPENKPEQVPTVRNITVGNTTVTLHLEAYDAGYLSQPANLIFAALQHFHGLDDETLRQACHLSPQVFTRNINMLQALNCVRHYENHSYLVPVDPDFKPEQQEPRDLQEMVAAYQYGHLSQFGVNMPTGALLSRSIDRNMLALTLLLQGVSCCHVTELQALFPHKTLHKQLGRLHALQLITQQNDVVQWLPRDRYFDPEMEFKLLSLSYKPEYAAGFICAPFAPNASSAFVREELASAEAKKQAQKQARHRAALKAARKRKANADAQQASAQEKTAPQDNTVPQSQKAPHPAATQKPKPTAPTTSEASAPTETPASTPTAATGHSTPTTSAEGQHAPENMSASQAHNSSAKSADLPLFVDLETEGNAVAVNSGAEEELTTEEVAEPATAEHSSVLPPQAVSDGTKSEPQQPALPVATTTTAGTSVNEAVAVLMSTTLMDGVSHTMSHVVTPRSHLHVVKRNRKVRHLQVPKRHNHAALHKSLQELGLVSSMQSRQH